MNDTYIFVTGGAGYIGSHTVRELLSKGYNVVVYDDLSEGYREFIPETAHFVHGNILDTDRLNQVFKQFAINTVIHFAGFISMGESMENPWKYFNNNVFGTLCLLNCMHAHGISKIVFSSSAGVHGNPERVPIEEVDRKDPTNPYGESKLMVENCLKWYDISHNIKSISIRYFNASGAAPDASLGEAHRVESHIIPLAIATALGKRDSFKLFGTDYQTPDGTCVRDYIHVLDLAEAHILAIKALETSGKSDVFNAGTGTGYSNSEILEMVKKVSGRDFRVDLSPRRPGDADIVVASPKKIMKAFGWEPKHSDLENIIKTAVNWHTSEKYKNLALI